MRFHMSLLPKTPLLHLIFFKLLKDLKKFILLFLIHIFLALSIMVINIQSAMALENPSQTKLTRQTAQESLQIIVTTQAITIGTNFNGTDFYIAGTLENIDPLLRRQGRYGVIAVLEGPFETAALYKKERRLGVWLNAPPLKFGGVPQFYALASSRPLQDITSNDIYKHLGLGIKNVPMQANKVKKEAQIENYRTQLIDIKKQQDLYGEDIGGIVFGSANLFTAHFYLPQNVPVGSYKVKAYLFRDGEYQDQAETRLEIQRDTLAYTLYHATVKYSFWYGLLAVLVAIFIGFIGRLIFHK